MKELFSLCRRPIGHYQIAVWFRVAGIDVNRTNEGDRYNSYIGERVSVMIKAIVRRVEEEDLVVGTWHVPRSDSGTVWCDASVIALGTVLHTGDGIVEDAAGLRKENDFNHISVAKLEAALKGINLCIKWG